MFPLDRVDIDSAIESLRDLAQSLTNIQNSPISPGIEGATIRRDEYLEWVDRAEPRLVGIFGPNALSLLHNEHYDRIWSMAPDGPRPIALVNNEAARQRTRLSALTGELERRGELFGGEEEVFVVDTNVFLHYHTLNQPEAWRDEALRPTSLVIVPLRVVQELDLKKQSANKRLARRARRTLGRISEVLGDRQLVGSVVDGVTLRVVIEQGVDDVQADEEILNVAERVQTYARRPITVVTGDLAMQLRSTARGLRSSPMPPTLQLPLDEPDGELGSGASNSGHPSA